MTPLRVHSTSGLQASFCLLLGSLLTAAIQTRAADFKSQIEPLLIKRCSECHGADAQKAKFRIDLKAEAFKGGKSGKPGITPGNSAQSSVYQRVTSSDPDEVMPPKGPKLTAQEIAWIKAWIDQGAPWQELDPKSHWSFIKPQRPSPPATRNQNWGRNDVDRFILAKLESEHLKPAPEADKATLIRRLSLDLIGLPPTPQEIETFSRDHTAQAYERLVDRLLESPHHGEHAARAWLDLARYADSNGYQVDLSRSIWPYRDWVIQALNKNMPFDQFTIEQLAGDLLPNATLDQRIATGFNRNTKVNDEGGGDAEEYRTKAVKDRVATTSTTWLGLTMVCAECHTHKYDPLTQEDYYKLYAIFNSSTDSGNYSVEPAATVPAPNMRERTAEIRSRLSDLQQQLAKAEQSLPKQQSEWEAQAQQSLQVWTPLTLTNAVSTGGASYAAQPDGSLLATGVNPTYDTITFEALTSLKGITAVLLEVLPDPSLPKNGPGRWSQTGNFILDEFSLWATPEGSPVPQNLNTNIFFSSAAADWEQLYYRAEHAIDRNPKTGWAIGPRFGAPHFLIASTKDGFGTTDLTRLGFKFEHYHGNNHSIGRFKVSITTERDPTKRWPIPTEVAEILKVPKNLRKPAQLQSLANHFRSRVETIRSLEREIFRLNQKEAELANTRFTSLVMQERPEPRSTYIHVRGNFLEKGPSVSPGVPSVFGQIPEGVAPNRLALARWLVDPNNPLTARVTVNRFWERLFGTGIVKTSEDFGRQGEPPSHPELLDWLATEFMRTGWNMKALQKTIVMSATYRQSAASDALKLEKDPYNRLLARGPRFRLDAEGIRDVALSVSGLLDPSLGGPSVYPVQVPNLWKEIGFLRPEIGMDEWPVSEGRDRHRRAVYTFWRRVCTYPTFATFDAPSRDVCTARRPRTNTPLQALAALNDATFIEAAQALAQRIITLPVDDPSARIDFAFQLCTARKPSPKEKTRLLSLYREQLQSFKNDAPAASALTASTSQPHTAELAAWTVVANVLLNLDETLTKG